MRSALQGERAQDARRSLYCESLQPAQFQCGPLNGIVEGAWKYIRAPRQELYDLTHDPGESENVIEREPQVAQRLRDRLEELLPEMESAAPDRGHATVDPDAVNRLQSLGYVGGDRTPPSSAFDPTLEDPKDFSPIFERIEEANALSHSNRAREAEKELLDIVSSRPGLIAAHRMLAQLAHQDHRGADAVAHYAKIVDILTAPRSPSTPVPAAGPDLATAHVNLAFALREIGRDGEAIDHYEKALAIEPDYVKAHNNLGNALERTGRHAEAIAHYERALRIDPDYMDAHFNLGLALEQTGQLKEAIGHYEKALELARSANLTTIAAGIQMRLAAYRDRRPSREEAGR